VQGIYTRILRRTDECEHINGKAVKPAKEVKIGDKVTVTFGSNSMSFEVLSVDEHQTKQSAETMYRIIN
jgi:ribosomal 50S subunit-recycling heat shock protein